MSTIVGVFEACDSLVLIMHRDAKPDNLLFHDPNSCVLPSLHWSAMSR
jgi:serine/threonine protein kinase